MSRRNPYGDDAEKRLLAATRRRIAKWRADPAITDELRALWIRREWEMYRDALARSRHFSYDVEKEDWSAQVLREKYLYHFTNWPNMKKIRKEGLTAGQNVGVYLTNNAGFRQWAGWVCHRASFLPWRNAAEEKYAERVIALRVKVSALDPMKLYLDLHGTRDSRIGKTASAAAHRQPYALMYESSLPPEWLEWAYAEASDDDLRVGIRGPWQRLRS